MLAWTHCKHAAVGSVSHPGHTTAKRFWQPVEFCEDAKLARDITSPRPMLRTMLQWLKIQRNQYFLLLFTISSLTVIK